LVDAVGLDVVSPGDEVAIKVHFGDDGTTRFLRPMFAREVVDRVVERRGVPFLTDTLTLYKGARSSAPRHLALAIRNGFGFAQVGAPLIIADGLRSRDVREVDLAGRGKHFGTVRIAAAAHEADALVCISHVKGHLAAGFGATLKNLSMGLGSRAQKQAMHADVKPRLVDRADCVGCGDCAEICPAEAALVVDGVAEFDHDACIGCAECIAACTEGAIALEWGGTADALQEKMVEVAAGALASKRGKAVFFNFVVDVTPDCDCFPFSDTPIVPDVGVLASLDPVAVEQAAYDLVTGEPSLPGSKLDGKVGAGEDKFRALYPAIDPTRQIVYAEELGLGSRDYRLHRVRG
jgi:hypothetical protein